MGFQTRKFNFKLEQLDSLIDLDDRQKNRAFIKLESYATKDDSTMVQVNFIKVLVEDYDTSSEQNPKRKKNFFPNKKGIRCLLFRKSMYSYVMRNFSTVRLYDFLYLCYKFNCPKISQHKYFRREDSASQKRTLFAINNATYTTIQI